MGVVSYLGVLLPVAVVASWISSVASRIVPGGPSIYLSLIGSISGTACFFSLLTGVALFISGKARKRLEGRNRELEKQVAVGQITLQAHEAELQAAHEIQAHLLPRELPQIKPFQIACA